VTKPFANPPAPLRQRRPSGMWTQSKTDWVQYEGQHEGRTVWVRYIGPERTPEGRADLSRCEVEIEPYDGVL
jgi:hypothetical protein